LYFMVRLYGFFQRFGLLPAENKSPETYHLAALMSLDGRDTFYGSGNFKVYVN